MNPLLKHHTRKKYQQRRTMNNKSTKGNKMKNLSQESQEIIESLREEGFEDDQIAAAMCDGEYLGKEGISQKTSEEVYLYCDSVLVA